MPITLTEDVLDHMANAMVEPGLRRGEMTAYPAGTRIRRLVLQRALDAAADRGFHLKYCALKTEAMVLEAPADLDQHAYREGFKAGAKSLKELTEGPAPSPCPFALGETCPSHSSCMQTGKCIRLAEQLEVSAVRAPQVFDTMAGTLIATDPVSN